MTQDDLQSPTQPNPSFTSDNYNPTHRITSETSYNRTPDDSRASWNIPMMNPFIGNCMVTCADRADIALFDADLFVGLATTEKDCFGEFLTRWLTVKGLQRDVRSRFMSRDMSFLYEACVRRVVWGNWLVFVSLDTLFIGRCQTEPKSYIEYR